MKMKNTTNVDNIDVTSSYAFDSVWAMATLFQQEEGKKSQLMHIPAVTPYSQTTFKQ